MELRSFALRIGLCVLLLAIGHAQAQAQSRVQSTSAQVRDWVSDVVTKIAEADRSRDDRSRTKMQGTVTMRIEVAADGFVNRVEVEHSSGSDDLDQRARSAARAASPFGPPPPSLLTNAGTTELSFPLRLRP